MDEDGFEYVHAEQKPPDWEEAVAAAASFVKQQLEKAATDADVRLEPINSNRLQYKFARTVSSLPAELHRVVQWLEAHVMARCGSTAFALQDCYALYTPEDEVDVQARAPQQWHLDAIKQFPVAALLLRGEQSTEFAAGAYSDFSAELSPAKLETWCAPWKLISATTWDSDSVEEWEHWNHHLHASGEQTVWC